MMLRTARRVAWLIVILGVLAAAASLIISQANLADNFLTFSLTQLLWMGVLYIIVGIILLLLLRPAAEPVVTASGAASAVSAAASFSPDPQDLTIIEGIGPKSKAALNKAGIYTFTQLARHSPEDLLRIVRDEHGVQVVGNATATWVKQARFIINGDLEGLKLYQERLQAGRE
ncbi:MAG: hypothetical protein JXN59_13410 [Anaerolineae bacterium]|nr:hypothetical protein [Anaerolineae bacterium]